MEVKFNLCSWSIIRIVPVIWSANARLSTLPDAIMMMFTLQGPRKRICAASSGFGDKMRTQLGSVDAS